MRDLEDYRKVRRRLAQKWCGIAPDSPMTSAIHAETASRLAHVLALPVQPKSDSLVNSLGQPYMMLGLTGIGVGHPLL